MAIFRLSHSIAFSVIRRYRRSR